MGLDAIIDGHLNELLGLNVDMKGARLKVCKKCPLCKETTLLGPVCNSKLWYNKETGDVSTYKKDGYVNGCGCRLNAKTTLATAECPLGKW